jgi:glutamate racemase
MKTIYLADSKNAPYGQKSKKKLSHWAWKIPISCLKWVKLIVVACNTATTNAIQELRAKYNVPLE